jgi:hypothetical protein
MALTITARTYDQTKSVSLIAAPYSVKWDGINRGAPQFTGPGAVKSRNEVRTTDGDRNLRRMSWKQMITKDTIGNLMDSYESLKDIICQPRWELVLNPGGSESDRYYDCFAVTSVPDFTGMMATKFFHDWTVEFDARPFSRGAAVDLPRNLITDALMCENHYYTDGIVQGFSAHATTMTGTRTRDTDYGGQKIVIAGYTAGSANEWYGVVGNAFAVTAALKYSYRIKMKTSPVDETTLTNLYVQIFVQYNDGSNTIQYLRNSQTAVTTDTEFKLENQTAPAGATAANFYIRLKAASAAACAGTLWAHEAMAICNDSGSGATAVANLSVTDLTITAGGNGYINGATATFPAPDEGTAPTVDVIVTNGVVTGFENLDNSGVAVYYSEPSLTFAPVTSTGLPKGKDGGTLFYCSEVYESPATVCIKNVPGDVDATCIIQFGGSDHTVSYNSRHVNTAGDDWFILGNMHQDLTVAPSGGFVISWYNTASTYALGGYCSNYQNDQSGYLDASLPDTLKGRYLIVARVKSGATGCSNSGSGGTASNCRQLQLNQYSNADIIGDPYQGPYTYPYYQYGEKWILVPLGVFEFPLDNNPDWEAGYFANYLRLQASGTATGGSGWQLDYLAFIPTDNGHVRAEWGSTSDNTYCLGVTADTTSSHNNVYRTRSAASADTPVGFPFYAASSIRPAVENYDWSQPTLKPGVANFMCILASIFKDDANTYHSINSGLMSIRYVPRFLE